MQFVQGAFGLALLLTALCAATARFGLPRVVASLITVILVGSALGI